MSAPQAFFFFLKAGEPYHLPSKAKQSKAKVSRAFSFLKEFLFVAKVTIIHRKM